MTRDEYNHLIERLELEIVMRTEHIEGLTRRGERSPSTVAAIHAYQHCIAIVQGMFADNLTEYT